MTTTPSTKPPKKTAQQQLCEIHTYEDLRDLSERWAKIDPNLMSREFAKLPYAEWQRIMRLFYNEIIRASAQKR